MADVKQTQTELEFPKPPEDPVAVWRLLLEPINHGLASATRKALEMQVPAHSVIEMYLNHLASTVAMIEPAGAREETLKNLVSSFAPMVRRHVDARMTSPGGVIMPRGTKQ